MPPLMLTPDEIEAAVLGAQWVAGLGDLALANAARDLIAKITSVVPERLRPIIVHPAIGTRPAKAPAPDRIDLARTHERIQEGRKIEIDYLDQHGIHTVRVLWPIILGFLDDTRMLAAWCELRQDFRHFRADRIAAATFLDDRYEGRPATLRQRWKRDMEKRRSTGDAA
jgi:predicted DNA-binding transcriptional regulator YafY